MPANPEPYIPKGGIRVQYRKRPYTLRWVNGTRMLVNSQGVASYALEPKAPGDEYFFDVFSVETGKQQSPGIACFMVQCVRGQPLPKRPWWH